MAQTPDANIGFTLTPADRSRLIRVLDSFAEAIPNASAILTDLAGRIVEIARKPLGVNLEGIAALAAGCHASTQQLAGAMNEVEFALLFEHENDRQVYVWPVARRALLVVLLKGSTYAEQLEKYMEGKLGIELEAVVTGAREPLKSVPPPRIDPAKVPPAISEKVRSFNASISDLQAAKPAALAGPAGARLLKVREDLLQAMSGEDWDRVSSICGEVGKWLSTL